jgi:hypothetical protein
MEAQNLVGCAGAFPRNTAAQEQEHVIKRSSLEGMTEAALWVGLRWVAAWPLALHPEFSHGHWVIAAKTFRDPLSREW